MVVLLYAEVETHLRSSVSMSGEQRPVPTHNGPPELWQLGLVDVLRPAFEGQPDWRKDAPNEPLGERSLDHLGLKLVHACRFKVDDPCFREGVDHGLLNFNRLRFRPSVQGPVSAIRKLLMGLLRLLLWRQVVARVVISIMLNRHLGIVTPRLFLDGRAYRNDP